MLSATDVPSAPGLTRRESMAKPRPKAVAARGKAVRKSASSSRSLRFSGAATRALKSPAAPWAVVDGGVSGDERLEELLAAGFGDGWCRADPAQRVGARGGGDEQSNGRQAPVWLMDLHCKTIIKLLRSRRDRWSHCPLV